MFGRVAVRAPLHLLCPARKALIEDGCVNCRPIGIAGCLGFLPIIGIVMSPHVIGVLLARLENDIKIGTHMGYNIVTF
jgi:hypothetical protein